MEPDFSGYVTKANLRCTDGRTIAPGAFAHQDGQKVPLVYGHKHDDVSQVLGHVILSKKEDGVWGDAFFNTSAKAVDAKAAVQHKDLDKMSVWAKDLDERSDFSNRTVMVHDGEIQEVSLVLAGANPGAIIHNVMAHDVNGVMLDPEEDLLVVSGEIMHADTTKDPAATPADAPAQPDTPPADTPEDAPPAQPGETTVADELATLTDEQRAAVNQFIEDLVPDLLTQALAEEPVLQHSALQKGSTMNVFDQTDKSSGRPEIKHSDMKAVLDFAKGPKGDGGDGAVSSLREFVRGNGRAKELMHADTYGVQDLEILFPEAQNLMTTPKFIDRRQEWVRTFMNGAGKSPFSRVRTMHADITADEARARGYIKGNKKVEEVFPIFKRETGPAWIYKKQKLDRQDIIDVQSFDLVAWMKVEMRGKLDEELARAALFSDGRPAMVNGDMNPDKILEPTGASGNGIRSIINDDDLYTTRISVPLAANASGAAWNVFLDAAVGSDASEFYMGSGNKTAFMPFKVASKLLTIRDDFGHRIYRNLSEVAGDMDVAQIVRVPSELFPEDTLAIVLDLADYNFGTDRGGELTFFDDFDIDFNQYKYLYEVYLSGALVTPYAAQVYVRVDPAGTLVEDIPLPVVADNVITIPTAAGVDYKRTDTNAVVAGGSTITLNDTNLKQVTVEAFPKSGFYFDTDADVKDSKTFRYKAPSA